MHGQCVELRLEDRGPRPARFFATRIVDAESASAAGGNRTHTALDTACYFYYKKVAMSGDRLGRFEHFLLLAVMRLGDQAYGMTIRRVLAEHTGRDIAVGAIYTALARLERRGLVQSWLGQPTAERGGKAKRHYRVLASGKKALDRAEAALTGLSQDLRRAPKRS
jgi:PadR family transcriptional regulator